MKKLILLPVLFLGLFACEEEVIVPEITEPSDEITVTSDITLSYINSIGVPMADPKGIASDGENLWFFCGEYNADAHTLISYNPATHSIEKNFTFDNIIEELGTGIGGIAFDGTNIWCTTSGNTDKMFCVDPETGEIIRTWASPTNGGPVDMCYGRGNLWISCGMEGTYKVNPVTGGSNHFTSFSRENNRIHGIEIIGDQFWMQDNLNQDIHVYDVETAEYLETIPNGILKEGKFCLHQGQLAVLDNGGVKFYEVIE